jgi:BolA protein
VRIEAEAFRGLSRLRRHRLVYDAVGPLMPQGIHALAIDAIAPGEA